MIYLAGLVVTFFVAVGMITIGLPDRVLYPVSLGVFVLFVIIFRGSGDEVHA